jgi:PKD repeat protein
VSIVDVSFEQSDCTFTFTADLDGDEPFTYLWDFGDGATSTDTMPVHAYDVEGSYTVTLEVWNCNGGGYDSHELVVECEVCDPPTNLDMSWTPLQPGEGVDVTFSGSASGDEPLTYAWDFGDGAVGAGITVTHAYAAAGEYVVALEVSNACGSAEITDTITVFTETVCVPVEIEDVTTSIVGCEVSFTPELSGDLPFEYLWDLGDGVTSTEAMPVHTYAEPGGTFTVTLEVWNCAGDGNDSYELVVTVSCAPPTYDVYLPLVFKAYDFTP